MTTTRARLVVLASGRGSNFVSLLGAIRDGRVSADVVALVTDRPDAKALETAREAGLSTHVEPLAKGADRDAWSARLADAVAGYAPDAVILAGFMRVLAPSFIDRFEGRILNVHPALLPSFKGHDGPAQALAAGVTITGCTVHLVDRGVDTGRILAQAAVPVLPGDDVARLHARIQVAEHQLFPSAIADFLATSPRALDPAHEHARLYAPPLPG